MNSPRYVSPPTPQPPTGKLLLVFAMSLTQVRSPWDEDPTALELPLTQHASESILIIR